MTSRKGPGNIPGYNTISHLRTKCVDSSRSLSGWSVDPVCAEAGHPDPGEEHDQDALLQEPLLGARLVVVVVVVIGVGGLGVVVEEKVPEGGARQLRPRNIPLWYQWQVSLIRSCHWGC